MCICVIGVWGMNEDKIIRWRFNILEEINEEVHKTEYIVETEVGEAKLRVIQRNYGSSEYLYTEYEYEFNNVEEFVQFLIREHEDVKDLLAQIINEILFEKSIKLLDTIYGNK